MSELFLNDRITLHCGECLEILKTLSDCSIDSCVTDPPYHLTSIVKRFGPDNAAPALSAAQRRYAKTGGADRMPGPDQYGRLSTGFMGKRWDGGDIAFQPEVWREVWRVLKPGAHLLSFGGTRTYHRMACAIEDARFEIRDCIQWLYGSGFPKSHNAGNGWGTALKPACEPIVLARKPLSESTVAANVLRWRTGAINIDACRVGIDEAERETIDNRSAAGFGMGNTVGGNQGRESGVFKSHTAGRWPANVITDGGEEVVAEFPDRDGSHDQIASESNNSTFVGNGKYDGAGYGDEGSAARFFYTAKADADDRLGSKHPTVKPLDLMQYLVRLVTPPQGTVLDCFAGTGTTGEAAWREGLSAVLIEREEEYQADIRRRMALTLSGLDERARESIKAKTKDKPVDHGPLFGGND